MVTRSRRAPARRDVCLNERRIRIDLYPEHLKALGRIRVSLGRWGNPATMSMAIRTALEVLDEQLHPKRVKEPEEAPQDGIWAGLL